MGLFGDAGQYHGTDLSGLYIGMVHIVFYIFRLDKTVFVKEKNMSRDYSKLQNGSDIRGVAMDAGDGREVNLGYEQTLRLTAGFASWLSEKTGKDYPQLTVSVGHDSRLTAKDLKEAI